MSHMIFNTFSAFNTVKDGWNLMLTMLYVLNIPIIYNSMKNNNNNTLFLHSVSFDVMLSVSVSPRHHPAVCLWVANVTPF